MFTPQQVEAIEAEAWQNMFDIAPENFRKQMNLYYEKIGGAICFVFPKYPVVHFNMVIGLGFTEIVSKEILQQVDCLYANEKQPVYMIQFCDAIQQCEPGIFETMNYRVGGGWERITWQPVPVEPLQISRNIHIEEVTLDTAAAWEKFILDIYRYPAYEWLFNFAGKKGWHHFLAYENNNIVACRSIYIGKNNFAWSGVEAPVPVVMTNDLEPDRILWKHIQQFCLEKNVALLVADIEMPAPERNTLVYKSFEELGFTVQYLRKLYRKK